MSRRRVETWGRGTSTLRAIEIFGALCHVDAIMAWRQMPCSKDLLERSLGLGRDSDFDRTPEKGEDMFGGSLELAAFEVRNLRRSYIRAGEDLVGPLDPLRLRVA
jgi:hypothetical protein